jgi:hypothetical protein
LVGIWFSENISQIIGLEIDDPLTHSVKLSIIITMKKMLNSLLNLGIDEDLLFSDVKHVKLLNALAKQSIKKLKKENQEIKLIQLSNRLNLNKLI